MKNVSCAAFSTPAPRYFDIVVDGANVGYYKQNYPGAPKHINYEQVWYTVVHYSFTILLQTLTLAHFNSDIAPCHTCQLSISSLSALYQPSISHTCHTTNFTPHLGCGFNTDSKQSQRQSLCTNLALIICHSVLAPPTRMFLLSTNSILTLVLAQY